MNNRSNSIKINYFFNLFASIITLIVPFVTAPYVSRVFNASVLGVNSYISTVSNIFVIVSTFGFYVYGQREISKCLNDREQISKVFWNVFFVRLVLTALCSLIYIFIYLFSDRNPLYIIYLFSIIHVAFDCGFLFAGLQKFRLISIVTIIVKIVSCASIFLFVRNVNHIWIYAIITVFNLFASSIFIFFACFGTVRFVKFRDLDVKKTFTNSFKLFLPTIAISIFTLVDKLLIQWLSFGTTTLIIDGVETSVSVASMESGFYVQADNIISICLTIIYSLQTVMISRNSEELKKGNSSVVLQNIYRANQFISFLTIPMMIGLLIVSPCFCNVFFGNGYEKCSTLLQIASVSFLFSGFHSMIGNHYLIASGKERLYTISLFAGGIINILLNLALIPFFGSVGAMIGTVIGKASISLAVFVLTRKELRHKSYLFNYIKCLIPAAFMACVLVLEWVFLFKQQSSISALCVLVISGAFIYLCVTTMIKGNVIKDEWNNYFYKINKIIKKDKE